MKGGDTREVLTLTSSLICNSFKHKLNCGGSYEET